MSLNIKDKETHTLARRLSKLTGQSMTAVVRESLREKLEREERRRKDPRQLEQHLLRIVDSIKKRPDAEGLTAEEIIGYDDEGLPGPSGDFSLTDVKRA